MKEALRARSHPCPPPALIAPPRSPSSFPHLVGSYLNRSKPIPIEPVPTAPPPPTFSAQMTERLAQQTRLHKHVPFQKARRRVYLDMGARWFNSSIAGFLDEHPESHTFEIKAWEIIPKFVKELRQHPNVEVRLLLIGRNTPPPRGGGCMQ